MSYKLAYKLLKVADSLDRNGLLAQSDNILRIATEIYQPFVFQPGLAGSEGKGATPPLKKDLGQGIHDSLKQGPSSEGFMEKSDKLAKAFFNLREPIYQTVVECLTRYPTDSPEKLAQYCINRLSTEHVADLRVIGQQLTYKIYRALYEVYKTAAKQIGKCLNDPEKLRQFAEMVAFEAQDRVSDVMGLAYDPEGQTQGFASLL